MDLQTLFTESLALQQKGFLEEARMGYRRLLIHLPTSAAVWALKGLTHVEDEKSDADWGPRLLLRALVIDHQQAMSWSNLGLARLKTGHADGARQAFQNAIALAPDHQEPYRHLADLLQGHDAREQTLRLSQCLARLQPGDETSLFLWGRLCYENDELARAYGVFSVLAVLNPSNATYPLYRASCQQKQGLSNPAFQDYGRVLHLLPDHRVARMNRCSLALDLQRYSVATEDGRWLVVLDPGLSDAYYNLGLALQARNHLDLSWSSYSRSIVLTPDRPLGYVNRGSIAFEKNHLDDSIRESQSALILAPDAHEAYVNLGNALKQGNRASEGLRFYDHALDLLPGLPDALSGKGLILMESLAFDAASRCFDEAISLDPKNAGYQYNKAHLNLLKGDYATGWPLFESRWQTKSMRTEAGPARIPDAPLWLGQDSLQGKRILIWPEQGFGDALQFCRYIPELVALGAEVVFEVRPALKRLMSDSFPEAKVISSAAERGNVDAHCPLMSLPLAFSTRLDRIPGQRPYLRAQPKAHDQFGDLLENASDLKVGLVWSGGLRPDQPETWAVNARRNIELAELQSLKHEGVSFFSLQKGEPAESQLRDLQAQGWEGPTITPLADRLDDFADTAVILDALDLLISVDTSTAHLAAALGKPVWLLNRFDTCWRWLAERDDSPWYPTVRLFRQDESRLWTPVITRVSAALSAYVLTAQKG